MHIYIYIYIFFILFSRKVLDALSRAFYIRKIAKAWNCQYWKNKVSILSNRGYSKSTFAQRRGGGGGAVLFRCTYTTPDMDAGIVAALLTAHTTSHAATNRQGTTGVKTDMFRRPSVSLAGTSEDWTYFPLRWNDYVLQLLECCEEPLRKDLTRSFTGSLVNKTEDEFLDAIISLAYSKTNKPDPFRQLLRPESAFYWDNQTINLINCSLRPNKIS